MVINPKDMLEQEVGSINQSSDVENALNQSMILSTQNDIASTSKVGVKVNEVTAGFQSKSAVVDDVVLSFPESEVDQVTNEVAIAQITKDVPGLKNKLIKTVSPADQTSLTTLTGSSELAKNGFQDVAISLAQPEAMLTVVKNSVPDATESQLKAVAEQLVDIEQPLRNNVSKSTPKIDDFEIFAERSLRTALNAVVGNVTGSKNNLSSQRLKTFNAIVNGAKNSLAKVSKGFSSLIENLAEIGLQRGANVVNEVTVKNGVKQLLSESQSNTIFRAISRGDYETAADVLRPLSSFTRDEIMTKLRSIDLRASTIISPVSDVELTGTNHNTIPNQWQERTTESQYFNTEPLSDQDEIQIELSNIDREVTEIIINSLETPVDVRITAQELYDHIEQTEKRAPSTHYLITKNGHILRIRPVDVEAQDVSNWANNHYKRSIIVSMVGGINAYSNTPDLEQYVSAESYTPSQWKALDTFLKAAFNAMPGIQVIPASEVTHNGDGGPFFNVSDHIKAKYGKDTLFTDLANQEPFTREELSKNIRKGKI